MPKARRSLAKERLESSNDDLDSVDVRLQEWKRKRLETRLIESYLSHNMIVSLYLMGYVRRNGLEGPPKNLRLTFQRAHEGLVPPVVPKIRYRNDHYARAYDMKVSVLVNIVERVEFRKRPANFYEMVVPSVVWLHEFDSPSLLEAEILNLRPLSRRSFPLLAEDREGGVSFDPIRNPTPVSTKMKLKDDVVESGTKVEQSISEDESASCSIKRWPRVSIEAVFESYVLSLHGDAIRVDGVVPRVVGSNSCDFVCESFVVLPGSIPLLPSASEISCHGRTSPPRKPEFNCASVFRQTLLDTPKREEVLATYTLQLTGPALPKWTSENSLAFDEQFLRETEENLTDLLPDGYSVQIKEWDNDE